MEKGKRKWVRIIKLRYTCTSIYSACNICVSMTLKKGGKTSKSIKKRGNIRITNMHKKYGRQDRDPGWLAAR